ncbi:TniQ family protein [Halalkalibacter oceani]|uniref:TniQ family protein n=1 Tax=Halalkalibacter oceani TaxID=1653776 RepID=UPI0033920DFA
MFTVWNEKKVRTPERSKCYSLEPMSMNSLDTESLTSYIQRLSEAHSISVSSFVKHLIFPTLYTDKNQDYSENDLYRVYYKSYSINGFNQQTSFFLRALKELTNRRDLKSLSWLKLSPLLTIGDIKVSRNWCPACLNEQKNENIIYEKLIWSLKSLTICLKHNCVLESTCPNCTNEIKQLDLYSVIGYCPKCKGWLGSNMVVNNNTNEENIVWQKWVNKNVEDLLKNEAVEFVDRDFILNKVSHFLSRHFNRTSNPLNKLAENMNYDRCTLTQWKRKAQQLSFESLLVLSYCVNTPIEVILFRENEINIKHISKFKNDLIKKKSYITLTTEEKRNLLYKFINSNEYPPLSLNEVTKQIGYKSNESLRYHFPAECSLISSRYKEYKSKINAEKVHLAKKAIRECVSTALEEGKVLNHGYIQSKVKIGKQFANLEIREYIEGILEKNKSYYE